MSWGRDINSEYIEEANSLLASVDKRLSRVERFLEKIALVLNPIPNPGVLQVVLGENMADNLTFKVLLPTLESPGDVESGELTVIVGEGEPQVIATAVEDTEVTGLEGPQGETVVLSFVYVDDAGNKSEAPAELTLVLEDTIPPQNPGSLGVEVVSES